jgi:hypothetical protein
MNARLVYPPAMPASMATASADGNGPAPYPDPAVPFLDAVGHYALTGRSDSCHQRRIAC